MLLVKKIYLRVIAVHVGSKMPSNAMYACPTIAEIAQYLWLQFRNNFRDFLK